MSPDISYAIFVGIAVAGAFCSSRQSLPVGAITVVATAALMTTAVMTTSAYDIGQYSAFDAGRGFVLSLFIVCLGWLVMRVIGAPFTALINAVRHDHTNSPHR